MTLIELIKKAEIEFPDRNWPARILNSYASALEKPIYSDITELFNREICKLSYKELLRLLHLPGIGHASYIRLQDCIIEHRENLILEEKGKIILWFSEQAFENVELAKNFLEFLYKNTKRPELITHANIEDLYL